MGKMDVKDFVIGALVGGIIGASSAILLAPKSGKELRSDINEKANVAKGKAIELTNTAIEKGNEYKHYALEKSNEITDAVKQKWESISDKTEEYVSLAETAASESKDSWIELVDQETEKGKQLAEQVVKDIEETRERLEVDIEALQDKS